MKAQECSCIQYTLIFQMLKQSVVGSGRNLGLIGVYIILLVFALKYRLKVRVYVLVRFKRDLLSICFE